MKDFWKGFLIGCGAVYFLGAVVFGLAAHKAMPFVNLLGDIYYGAIWPLTPLSVATGHNLYPIPDWVFRV